MKKEESEGWEKMDSRFNTVKPPTKLSKKYSDRLNCQVINISSILPFHADQR